MSVKKLNSKKIKIQSQYFYSAGVFEIHVPKKF
jgi:hypothetical protein